MVNINNQQSRTANEQCVKSGGTFGNSCSRAAQVLMGTLTLVTLTGGTCSQARVQSMRLMNEGVGFAAQRRVSDAVERLEQAAAVDPTNAQAYWNLGLVHMQMEQFEATVDDFQHAIAADSNVASYHERLGTVLARLERWDDARQAFERALTVDANLFKAHHKLAEVFEHQDNPQQALAHYTEAINRGPRYIPAYRSLGRLYADLDFQEQALQVLRAGLTVAIPGTEDEADLHYLLGTVYAEQQNLAGAVQEFRSALQIDPTNRDATFSLGWTYAEQDNRQEARRYLNQFLKIAGRDAPRSYTKAAQDKLLAIGSL